MKNISLYTDNGSWLTKVHPLTKLLYTITAIAIPLILGKLWAFPIMILITIFILTANRLLRKALPLFIFSITIIAVIFIIQGIFNQQNEHILFSMGPINFYTEGVLYACRISGNIFNILFSFAVFILSTDPEVFVTELEKRGFLPKFGYILNSVFQIIPQMMGTSDTIQDAQKSRGMETEGNLAVRAKAFIPLISPVVMSSLINTKERALALEVRGFGSKNKKTWLHEWKKHPGDRFLGIFLVALIAFSVFLRIFVL